MCFVYPGALGLLWSWVFEDISFGGGRVPESTIVDRRHGKVLGNVLDPCRYAFDSFTGWCDHGDLTSHQRESAVAKMELLTLILELCAIAGCPSLAGSTTSKTPNGSFFIGCDSRFQSSTTDQFSVAKGCRRGGREILNSPIRNACVAFGAHSLYVMLFWASTLKPNLSVPCAANQSGPIPPCEGHQPC